MNIDGHTRLIGLIGWPVTHSFSPAMHNAAAKALDLNWVYLPLAVRPAEVATAVTGLAALGFQGVNVTVPHKKVVMPHLSTIEPGAKTIGAVNTIVFKRDSGDSPQLAGYNTDWSGFLDDLQSLGVGIQGRDCLVLGAGGSARAVVYGLRQAGGRIHVLARRIPQAEDLAADLAGKIPIPVGSLSEIEEMVGRLRAPLIINTTPLGMTPQVERSVWPAAVPFPSDSFAYDLVYNPQETLFMKQARASGCQASNGLGMLIRQGAQAFTLWTGLEPDLNVMQKALPF